MLKLSIVHIGVDARMRVDLDSGSATEGKRKGNANF